MQKVTGVEQSKDILSKNRGLDLEGDPKYISQFSEAIFGEKLNLMLIHYGRIGILIV